MDVVVIGSGYVGITVACLADHGHKITCLEKDKKKVEMVGRGVSHIYEPGINEVLKRNVDSGMLKSTSDYSVVKDADVVFVCVGTPSREDGSIDLNYIESCATSIAEQLKNSSKYKVIILKSTVLPGTTKNIVIPILEKGSGKKAGRDFGVANNPEFLREGSGVMDFMNPDKIVIGGIDERSRKAVADIYSKFDQSIPRMFTDTNTAEMVKYANNSMLATRISFINEFANICEHYDVDIYEVARAIGMDSRIGPKFLNAGIGFGGSCFPKDVRAIISASRKAGIEPILMNSVIEVDEKQPLRMIDLAKETIGDISGKTVSVLGLSFKPETDDIRYSKSTIVIQALLKNSAKIKSYDPKAMENAKNIFGDRIKYSKTLEECIDNSDIIMIMTEWDEFKNMDLSKIKVPIIDGKRALDPKKALKKGITYRSIGWKNEVGDLQ